MLIYNTIKSSAEQRIVVEALETKLNIIDKVLLDIQEVRDEIELESLLRDYKKLFKGQTRAKKPFSFVPILGREALFSEHSLKIYLDKHPHFCK